MSKQSEFPVGQMVDHDGWIGVVVANISDGLYSAKYTRKDWEYLDEGLLVEFEQTGLVHFPSISDDDLVIHRSGVGMTDSIDDNVIGTIAIRLHGDALDPSHITEQLGVAPSKAWRKGDVSGQWEGRQSIARTGLWAIEWGTGSATELREKIHEAVRLVEHWPISASHLEGVESAKLDVFAAAYARSAVEFEYTSEQMQVLSNKGLRFCVRIELLERD